jgi:LysR family hydrogen peroxide-inducible transcriptional activator
MKGELKGNLSISVIPTIAPFLLPRFLQDFAIQFPNLKIVVREEPTKPRAPSTAIFIFFCLVQ